MLRREHRPDLRAWFASAPLAVGVRAALAERIVVWTLPALWVLIACAFATVIFAGELPSPTRFATPLALAVGLAYVQWLVQRARWLQSAAALSATLCIALCIGVLLNGVNAPAFAGLLALFPCVVPLFGVRGGLAVLAALVGAGAIWLACEHYGLALAVRDASPGLRIGLYGVFALFSWGMTAHASALLSGALQDAECKRRDAEAARRAEAATAQAFHAIFEQATTGMLLLTASGAITQANAHAASLLGSTQAALCATRLDSVALWGASQQPEVARAVEMAAAGKAHQLDLSVGVQARPPRVFQLRLSPFRDHGGGPAQVLVEGVELTELIDARSVLAESRRLDALGKLSGGVAHDMNNMLAAIGGGCDLVRLGHARGDGADVDAGVEVISASLQRAAVLVRQLLAFGRQDRFVSSDIDVNRLVSDMGELFSRTLRRSITVTATTSDSMLQVRGDKAALENALLNLALNAQDAMPAGGRLSLEVLPRTLGRPECDELDQAVEPGDFAAIRVRDTGAGMSPEVREHIFEPFFTTKPKGAGSGLGLAAVHGTVRNHHGAILVSSRQGEGTCFEVLLPAQLGVETTVTPLPEGPVPSGLRASVLLAEDEPLVRSIVSKMLTRVGCDVRAVNDGDSLLEALRSGARPDILVTDLIMPGLNGKQLIAALEAQHLDCPVLLMTGYAGEDVSGMLGELRCRHLLLRKPFTQAELMQALQQLKVAHTTQLLATSASA